MIEIWGDGAILAQLEGCKHNQEVFNKIAKEQIEAEYQRSGKQCRNKFKKLKGKYRKVRGKRSTTDEGRLVPGVGILQCI